MCAVMMESTLLAMAARKGTNSTKSIRSRDASILAMPIWLSTAVSPWPGKCLAQRRMGLAGSEWAPSMNAVTCAATSLGCWPKERILMMGLSGLLFTSATGAKIQWTPSALASLAVAAPSCQVAPRSSAALNAMLCGYLVVFETRMDAPRSKSAPTISGSRDNFCIPFRNVIIS